MEEKEDEEGRRIRRKRGGGKRRWRRKKRKTKEKKDHREEEESVSYSFKVLHIESVSVSGGVLAAFPPHLICSHLLYVTCAT